jgi:CHAT domain-containing protein
MLVRGPNDDEPDAYRTDLARSRDQRDRAESALAAASAGFRQRRDDIAADLARVASSLPEDACLVSYAQFGDVSPSMLAFVLRSPDAAPVAISLGTVARIDDAVSRWRHEASRGPLIAGRTDAQALDAYRAAGVRLRELVWDPLELPLDGRRIFVVPDGALHLVNFAALPVDGGRYLVDEDVLLHASSTERDLLPPNESVASGLLAVGGATFDDTVVDLASALPTFRGPLADCDAFRGIRFAPLPASREESEQVAALWRTIGHGDVLLLEGDEANERAVKGGAPGRRVLHFATHGFFLDPDCVESSPDGTRGIAGLAPTRARKRDPAMRALRLAGIALAGANRRDAATNEDGILTAEEIATLDLGGVQWAVLSACDTGTGDVDAREGIFGLRRAFRIAGARTVISSLWAVRDEDALVWMDELYRARLVDALDAATCTRRAARRLLEQARDDGKSTHPFTWAGFVAAGDWR